MKPQLLIIGMTAAATSLSFLDAPYPKELVLQHIPTAVALGLLALLVIIAKPTWFSYVCLITFLWLHILGARWIYSFVPYDAFAEKFVGVSLSDYFGWERNHYDRLVHFASGLLGVAPASECLQRCLGLRPLGAALLAICCVMAVGAVYEIVEWQIATIFSPAYAESYNGQQGDIWDPQKDMALAGFGALLAAGLLFRWNPSYVSVVSACK